MGTRGWFAAAALLWLGGTAFAQSAPDGLYLMTKVTPYGLDMDAYYFGNGQVARAPQYDVEQLGFDWGRANMPEDFGTAQVGGGNLRIDWAQGAPEEDALQPSSNGCFYWYGGQFCPVRKFASGTLDGTYTGGATASGGGGFVGNSRTISFSPDGRYRVSSLGGVEVQGDGYSAGGSASATDAGSYQIGPNSIVFQPDQGQPWGVSAFPYHDASRGGVNPNRIYFGGLMLSLQ